MAGPCFLINWVGFVGLILITKFIKVLHEPILLIFLGGLGGLGW